MPLYTVEVEYVNHQTFTVGADSASEAESLARKQMWDYFYDLCDGIIAGTDEFDVTDVIEC